MSFNIIRQDITKIKADAIVNSANTLLAKGGGVCGAIFEAAGAKLLQDACNKVAPIEVGDAVITSGFNLPAKYIIHVVGPIYQENYHKECERLLYLTYQKALNLAIKNKCRSIAFPLISSGIYGYPKKGALKVATASIMDFLIEHDINVFLVVFDNNSFDISKKLQSELKSYIDDNYEQTHGGFPRSNPQQQIFEAKFRTSQHHIKNTSEVEYDEYDECCVEAPLLAVPKENNIEDFIADLDEPFNESLLKLIKTKGKTEVEVYKRANLDRKLFSKIRSGRKGYTPNKRTILALAISLELSLNETENLLQKAGFALSHSQKFDVIVEFFIIHKRYDILEINKVLFNYEQPLLGSF